MAESINDSGMPANDDIGALALSGNGQVLAFTSKATNLDPLVPINSNSNFQVYVRNLATGHTQVVSVDSSGVPIALPILESVSISDDGSLVSFSAFTDAAWTGNIVHNYVRDLNAGTTTQLADGQASHGEPAISGDGRYVAFQTQAGTGSPNVVTIYDRFNNTSTTASVAPDGTTIAGGFNAMSDDGRYVVFGTGALDPQGELLRRDMLTGVSERVDVASDGSLPIIPSGSGGSANGAAISGDGQTVSFYIIATNFSTDDPGTLFQAYEHNFATSATTLLSRSASGAPQNGFLTRAPASLTYDGTQAAFAVGAPNFGEQLNQNGGYNAQVYVISANGPIDTAPPLVGSFSLSPKAVANTEQFSVQTNDDLSGIFGGEYFVSVDPGIGNGTPMTYVPSTYLAGTLSATIGTTLTPGVYQVDVRAQDLAGNWSQPSVSYLPVYDPSLKGVTGSAGRNDLIPALANGDILPGLTSSTQTDYAKYGFTVEYDSSGGISSHSKFMLDYSTGTNCGKPTANNCHDFSLTASSFDWLVVDNNNSRARFQGTATVTIDGVTTTNPFTVEGIDGDMLNPTTADHFLLKVFAPGADPSTATAIYQASGNVGSSRGVKVLP